MNMLSNIINERQDVAMSVNDCLSRLDRASAAYHDLPDRPHVFGKEVAYLDDNARTAAPLPLTTQEEADGATVEQMEAQLDEKTKQDRRRAAYGVCGEADAFVKGKMSSRVYFLIASAPPDRSPSHRYIIITTTGSLNTQLLNKCIQKYKKWIPVRVPPKRGQAQSLRWEQIAFSCALHDRVYPSLLIFDEFHNIDSTETSNLRQQGKW